ncbi:MAG: Fic family protein [Patescibacteria group bacterium]|nr:Fic family protein [Patescibacteria group bacterium]MBU0879616.1 Fic family protein [Patescibacteria group bacterium]MBU0879956.1 Fic family protein [Patescibacteria group bacterium]MBU0897711.1 Fic family protein [Patescibacteria group bacterium]MBU2081425.1 Fic family protein [Patescibacteria group bacterium]
MINLKYTISNKLLGNIKRIAEIVTDLNGHNFPKIVLAEMEKQALEISAFSSTSIEGNPLPLTDVKRILKNKPEYIRNSEREVLNYNQALVELNNLIKNDEICFNTKLLLKIQKTITDEIIEKYRCGHIRKEPVFVNNPKTRQTIYWPPDHEEVVTMLNELFGWLNKNSKIIDPLILAGIFHKQFVIIHPFVDGNGRTARLATKALLAKMGINTFNLFSFENYYNQNVAKYFNEVGVIGNYYDIKDEIDFTSWLEYFTDGIIDELLRVKKNLEKESITPDRILKNQHEVIINYIKEKGYIADRDYSALTKRSKPARNLDFNKLINLGFIVRVDKGKATYYKLK